MPMLITRGHLYGNLQDVTLAYTRLMTFGELKTIEAYSKLSVEVVVVLNFFFLPKWNPFFFFRLVKYSSEKGRNPFFKWYSTWNTNKRSRWRWNLSEWSRRSMDVLSSPRTRSVCPGLCVCARVCKGELPRHLHKTEFENYSLEE